MPDTYTYLVYILAYIGLFVTSFYLLNLTKKYKKKSYSPKSDKTVSIIIPAYNEEKSISKTIKSALSLNYPKDKLEIIVVNDGSTDETFKIAKSFETKNHPKIKVFSKENGGKGSALNLGINNSRAEIIVTMDADSFVRPDSLKKMIGYFYNEKVMSVTPSMGVYKPKNFWEKIQQIEYYMGVFLRKSFAIVNAIHITPGAFSAYKREFFVSYGGYDTKNITEDLEIALRIQDKNFIIENAAEAVIYTIVPNTFKGCLIQRKRWYTGLIKNLWSYKRLFGFKRGPLGTLVLPVAVATVALSVILTIYVLFKALLEIKKDLLSLQSINFQFKNAFELNSYIIERFTLTIFSNPVFIIAILFIVLLAFYLHFSKKHMQFKEGIKLSFILFTIFYSFLFAFWWIISAIYVLLNKKIIWREGYDGIKKPTK